MKVSASCAGLSCLLKEMNFPACLQHMLTLQPALFPTHPCCSSARTSNYRLLEILVNNCRPCTYSLPSALARLMASAQHLRLVLGIDMCPLCAPHSAAPASPESWPRYQQLPQHAARWKKASHRCLLVRSLAQLALQQQHHRQQLPGSVATDWAGPP